MNFTLNYYNECQQLSAHHIFTDDSPHDWSIPLIKDAKICYETTLYLKDISTWNIPGKTLIIDSLRPPITTNKSTSSLIKNFLKRQPCREIFLRMMTDHFDIYKNRPIVFGTFRCIPIKKISRNQSDWAFVHHVKDFYPDNKLKKSTFLVFDNNGKSIHVQVPCSEYSIKKQLKNAQKISELTYYVLNNFTNIFGMSIIRPQHEVKSKIDFRITSIDRPKGDINELLIDLLAHLYTISKEIIEKDNRPCNKSLKKTLKNPPKDLWKI